MFDYLFRFHANFTIIAAHNVDWANKMWINLRPIASRLSACKNSFVASDYWQWNWNGLNSLDLTFPALRFILFTWKSTSNHWRKSNLFVSQMQSCEYFCCLKCVTLSAGWNSKWHNFKRHTRFCPQYIIKREESIFIKPCFRPNSTPIFCPSYKMPICHLHFFRIDFFLPDHLSNLKMSPYT